jgi:hypothetical protein
MIRAKDCPMCRGGRCRITADGQRGICKKQGHWQKKTLAADESRQVQPGPIQHRGVSAWTQGIVRWSYSIVGRYVVPTLEQWELGFMRDTHIARAREVLYWHLLSFAFITYHRRLKIPLRSEEEERMLVGAFANLGTESQANPAEVKLLVECMNNPDGWEAEHNRFQEMVPGDAWSDPVIGEWPPSAE